MTSTASTIQVSYSVCKYVKSSLRVKVAVKILHEKTCDNISHTENLPSIIFITSGSAIAEEPRDALRQLKYYGRF